jgi:hypothetical protein
VRCLPLGALPVALTVLGAPLDCPRIRGELLDDNLLCRWLLDEHLLLDHLADHWVQQEVAAVE